MSARSSPMCTCPDPYKNHAPFSYDCPDDQRVWANFQLNPTLNFQLNQKRALRALACGKRKRTQPLLSTIFMTSPAVTLQLHATHKIQCTDSISVVARERTDRAPKVPRIKRQLKTSGRLAHPVDTPQCVPVALQAAQARSIAASMPWWFARKIQREVSMD